MNGNVNHIAPGAGQAQPLQFRRSQPMYPQQPQQPQVPQFDEEAAKRQEEELRLQAKLENRLLFDLEKLQGEEARIAEERELAMLNYDLDQMASMNDRRAEYSKERRRINNALQKANLMHNVIKEMIEKGPDGESPQLLDRLTSGLASHAAQVQNTYDEVGNEMGAAIKAYYAMGKSNPRTKWDQAIDSVEDVPVFGWLARNTPNAGNIVNSLAKSTMGAMNDARIEEDIAQLASDRFAAYLTGKGGLPPESHDVVRKQMSNYLEYLVQAGKTKPGSKERRSALQAMGASIQGLRALGVNDMQIAAAQEALEKQVQMILDGRIMSGAQAIESSNAEGGNTPLDADEMEGSVKGPWQDLAIAIGVGVSATRELATVNPDYKLNAVSPEDASEMENAAPELLATIAMSGFANERIDSIIANLSPQLQEKVEKVLEGTKRDILIQAQSADPDVTMEDIEQGLTGTASRVDYFESALADVNAEESIYSDVMQEKKLEAQKKIQERALQRRRSLRDRAAELKKSGRDELVE